MVGTHHWDGNWRLVGRSGARRVDVPYSRRRRRQVERRLLTLPAGTPIVLCAAAPGAAARCRGVAARADVELERRFLAFPSAATPAYLVADCRAPIDFFLGAVLAAPPGSRLSDPIGACLAVLRLFGAWRLVRGLAPGRIAVGRRV